MLIAELAQYLDSQNLLIYDEVGTTGNTFLSNMPDSPDDAISITPYAGRASDGVDGYDSPRVQVRVRDTSVVTGFNRTQAIYDELHGFHETFFVNDGLYILNCLCLTSGPVSMGLDENKRHEHILNFEITFENTNRRNT